MPEQVVVALPDTLNEFQVLQANDARATAARLGLQLRLLDADNNAVLQIQQLFKALNAPEPLRALVVEPVAVVGLERVVHKAAGLGVATALLNCSLDWVERVRGEFPGVATFAVGSDQREIGRLQGRQLAALLPAGGTVLYIQGPASSPVSAERLQGTQEALDGAPIRLLLIDAQWTEESADKAVRNWLRLKSAGSERIDGVAGQDDSMARGARRAFEAAVPGASSLPFLGIDGVPTVGQALVRAGQLAATIIMPSNVGPALEAVTRWLRSGSLPPASLGVPVASFPPEEQLRGRPERWA